MPTTTKQKLLEGILLNPGTSRVVGVSNKHNAGVVADGLQHRIEIITPVFRRHDDGLATHRLGRNGIHRKGMLREDHFLAGLHEGARHQFQDIVGTVTQRDLI